MGYAEAHTWPLSCNGLRRRTANLSDSVGGGSCLRRNDGWAIRRNTVALDLQRTAAQNGELV